MVSKTVYGILRNRLFRILCISGIAFISFIGFRDYGLSFDEPTQRNHLLIQAKHIFLKVGLLRYAPKSVLEATDLLTYAHRYYGVAGQYPLLLLEYFPGKFNPKKPLFWEIRHLYSRMFFLLSALAFFFIIKRTAKSKLVLFIGMMLYMLHPRIYANSFYNIKDLLFLSFMVFSMLFLIRFIEKPTWQRAVFLGIISAITINIRMMGVLIPLFAALWLLGNIRYNAKNIVTLGFVYMLVTSLTLVLVWPTLWISPVRLFGEAFSHFSNYSVWEGNTVFCGTLINGNHPPMIYAPVWIGITSPFSHLLTWALGIVIVIYQLGIALYKKQVSGQIIGVFSLYVVLSSYMAVLFFRSTLYGDWRHLYYLFPMLCVLSVIALENIRCYSKKVFLVLSLLIIASLAQTMWWMVRNHPYQYVYFNSLAGKDWGKRWDRDVWRLSYKQGAMKLIKNDGIRGPLLVFRQDEALVRSVWLLPENLQAMIKFVRNIKDADYAFGSYRNVIGDYPLNSYGNMKEYINIVVAGNKIMSIFKCKDKNQIEKSGSGNY